MIQLTRNWLLLVFIIVGPVIELVLLAHATQQGTDHMPAVVVDQDGSQASRQIASAIDNTDELDVQARLSSLSEAEEWLKRGQAVLAVILPAGLETDLGARLPQVQLIVDGTNSTAGAAALNAAAGAISAWMMRGLESYAGDGPAIQLRTDVRYNPTLDTGRFTITAQLGFVIYQAALVVAVSGLTRERELGTLEQLLVTPLQRVELVIGKAIPALIVAMVDFGLMWAVAVWGFHVPMRGSLALLVGLSLLFVLAEIGWGLTISAMSRTLQQAALMIFVLVMIDVAFSGYVMPVDRLPSALRAVAQIFPLQHYLLVVRSVMLKGGTLATLWVQALALGALSVASLTVAAVSLKRQLD